MVDENGAWARQSEAFWRAHHEAWKRSDLKSTAVLRGRGHPAQSVRQQAGDLQGRATAARTQAALPASRLKSPP